MQAPPTDSKPAVTPATAAGRNEGYLRWVALGLFLVGVLLRALYIFGHNPLDYLYSDMAGYYRDAKRFCDPHYVPTLDDTLYPPGTQLFFGTMMELDPGMRVEMAVQFAMSILVPLLLAGIGRDLFGRRTAWCVLALASLYFPLFDYSGYLLAEGPFLFTLVLSFWLLVRSLRTPGRPAAAVLGLLAGLALGAACAFKSVVLPAAFLVLLVLLALVWKRRLRALVQIAAAVLGLVMVLVPLSVRATRLNEGRFCLVANDAARNFLMGRFGHFQTFQFRDYEWGSPSNTQKGYDRTENVDAYSYENGKLVRKTWGWIEEHPLETVVLSFEHMFDLFVSIPWPIDNDWGDELGKAWETSRFVAIPWPGSGTGRRPLLVVFMVLFYVGVLLPAVVHLWRHRRALVRLDPCYAGEVLVLMPVLAVMITAFIFLGEARYRIPFDGFLLLLAARAYCGSRPEDPLLVWGVAPQ